jgi:GTP-binding protein
VKTAAAKFLTSASDPSGFPGDDTPEVAFVGRSNSGKSSAINVVTGARKLARVSKTPGRTQLVNFFELGPGRRIVDLPGYGFAKVAPAVRRNWRGLLEGYLGGRKNLRGLVVTLDIRRGVTELDRTLLTWAESLGLPLLLLLTKADKVSRNEAARQRRRVAEAAPAGSALAVFSALTGQGAEEARAQLEAWFTQMPAGAQKKAPGGDRGA